MRWSSTSPADLKSWEYLSTFGPANATGGVWECPDLFELPVDGDAGNTRWVLVVNLSPGGIAGGSGGQYFLGTFDGVTFRSETTVTEGRQADDSRMADYGWLDWGRDYYAAVSFSNVPDGRRLMIGWMNNWQYAAATPSRGLAQRDVTGPGGSAGDPRRASLCWCRRPVDPFEAAGTELFAAGRAATCRTASPGFRPRPPVTFCGSMPNSGPALPARWASCSVPAGEACGARICRRSRGAHCAGLRLPTRRSSAWTGRPPATSGSTRPSRQLSGCQRPWWTAGFAAPGVPGPLFGGGLRTGRPGHHHGPGVPRRLKHRRRACWPKATAAPC